MAHKLAQDALDKVANGQDPASEKQEARRTAKAGIPEADRFRNVAVAYMRQYRQGRATRRKSPPKPSTLAETGRLLGLKADPDNPGEWLVIQQDPDYYTVRLVEIRGDQRIQDIRKRDVIALLDGMKPYAANGLFKAINPLFVWAVSRRDLIAVSPVVW